MSHRRSATGHRLVAVAVLFVALGACDPAVLPSASGSPPAAIDGAMWAGTVCEAADQLSLAAGDPETGQRSGAWNDFETALAGGDEDAIDDAANAVLGHLTQGLRAADAAQGFEPGRNAAAEWSQLLNGLAAGVRTLRDGTVQRDAARVAEGRAQIEAAYEGHFEQATGQMRAVPLGNGTLPCG